MAEQIIETIGIDLQGRVNSLKLAERNMLLPVFETIINSVHAVEEAKEVNGKIEILVEREMTLNFNEDDNVIPAIEKFIVTDNGIGFNEINYSSFKKAHSTHKLEIGGKGVGRFTWLKAFNDVAITSIFGEGENFFQRNFFFNLKNETGIDKLTLNKSDLKRETKVELLGFKDPFKSKCPKKAETIANRIIEHCLIYFLRDDCPQIVLKDETIEINLNERFRELIDGKKYSEEFTVREFPFKITLLKWFEHEEVTHHKISLCANHREVEDFNLNRIFPDLNGKITDAEMGKDYLVVCYLEGAYLDKNVNDERTKIDFSRGDTLFDKELLNPTEIYSVVEPIIRKYFETEIANFKGRKIEIIRRYISENAPQYNILLNHPSILDNVVITEHMNDSEIDLKLYKAYQEIDFESRKETAILLNQISEQESPDELREQYNQVLKSLNELGKSKLSQYVVHRKYIIDLFEKSLGLNNSGKYELEKTVHEIIFPTKSTSVETDYSDQNLWLIDERLSFHTFLTSDKPLNSIDGLETSSTERPDLLIFNNPISYIEGEDAPLNSVVLFEFKRPMRENYPDDENPIEQIYDYIRKIKTGRQILKNGRPFPITDETRFFTYLICDINDKIIRWAENASLEKTHDGLGYYGYHKTLKCLIEILPFDQIVSNAKKRNKVLFQKLGI